METLTGLPSLVVHSGPPASGALGVGVHRLGPDSMSSVVDYANAGGDMHAILRVTVVQTGASVADDIPNVSGRHQVMEAGIRFVPHFPFEPGLSYRATFDPGPLCRCEASKVLTLQFASPRAETASLTEASCIFPSGDVLPENLLRFYVRFSNAMERGRAKDEIWLLGPDGEPVADVLYRAPVELWDRAMQVLTILLDPGRLKRGVGPNRELGPPLKAGQAYTLVIGAGMTDLFGRRLLKAVHKRFTVAAPVRQPVALEDWEMLLPMAGSNQPLVLGFPRSLDWAMLFHAITIASAGDETTDGRITIDRHERRWSFTPTVPWAAGRYCIRVGPALEDPCGNDLTAAFDRPLQVADGSPYQSAVRSLPFDIEALP